MRNWVDKGLLTGVAIARAFAVLTLIGCAPALVYPVDRAPNWVEWSGDWMADPKDFAACFQGARGDGRLLEACMIARGYRIRRTEDRAYYYPAPNAWLINITVPQTPIKAPIKGIVFSTRAACEAWKKPPSVNILRLCRAVVILNRPAPSVSAPRGGEVVWRPKNKGAIFATQEDCESLETRLRLSTASSPWDVCIPVFLLEKASRQTPSM